MNRKKLILDAASDLAVDFIHYDRKEDEQLTVGEIEKSIKAGEITIDDIINTFKNELTSLL